VFGFKGWKFLALPFAPPLRHTSHKIFLITMIFGSFELVEEKARVGKAISLISGLNKTFID
jgi:hypothetical protein